MNRLRVWRHPNGVRILIPAVERTLRVFAVMALIGAIVVPVGWGYEQRQKARTWQETACVYRLREVTRGTNAIATVERRGNMCAVLRDLGFDIDPFAR